MLKNLKRLSTAALLLVFLLYAHTLPAAQQAKFPTKAIKIMVPAGAGGSLGQEIRAIAPALEKQLGASAVIEYITGAEGMIAYNKFYNEKPDGYSLLTFNLASAISLELSREQAKYKVKNLVPVAGQNLKTFVLVVHPERWKNFEEFLQEAKQKNVSLAATGGAADLQGHLLESSAGLKFNWVPYTSAAEGMAAVAGRHVDAMLTFAITPRPMIKAGRLRALAVFSQNPDPTLPGVPNFKGLGHDEIPLLMVYGIFAAPPKTPANIVTVLEKAVKNACADPEFNKIADKIGLVVDYKSSSDLTKLTAQNYELLTKYKQFIK